MHKKRNHIQEKIKEKKNKVTEKVKVENNFGFC